MAGVDDSMGEAIQVIGHRGAAGLVPENTLGSFERAICLGADAVECDVHPTADGQVVILHDEAVDRTTNGTGRVMGLRASELKTLDAGCGQPVPLLGQLLDLLAGRCRLMCELKADGMEELVAGEVRSRGLEEAVTFISFRLERLRKIRAFGEGLRVGALIAAPTGKDIRQAMDVGVTYIGVHDRYASAGIVQRIREAGVAAGVWTPNTLEQMRAMIEMGATHITTDRPDILLEHLGRRSLPGAGRSVR